MMVAASTSTSRLARRIGFRGALVVGLGAMLGAGVFGAIGPAATAAGSGLLIGLCIAAALAACNATSSARLAARYPRSGGAYVYAGRELHPMAGFVAGSAFLIGKLGSCAAMALVFGLYVWPEHHRTAAILAVLACAVVNHLGITKTVRATAVILAVVAVGLLAVVVGTLGGGQASIDTLQQGSDDGVRGILESAGLLFFAFAGYARLSTLGEEVREPERVIPRATALSVVIAFVVYLLVMGSALAAVGADALAASSEPLVAAVRAGDLDGLVPLVTLAAGVATLGVLLSLLAGISRTAFAMAANRDLPRPLAAVHRQHRVPHVAGFVVAILVCGLVALLNLRESIAISSVLVLTYYALANLSALRLPVGRAGALAAVSLVGFLGCAVVVAFLPLPAVLAAGGVLCLMIAARLAVPRRSRPRGAAAR